jgi:hypothetical protein
MNLNSNICMILQPDAKYRQVAINSAGSHDNTLPSRAVGPTAGNISENVVTLFRICIYGRLAGIKGSIYRPWATLNWGDGELG